MEPAKAKAATIFDVARLADVSHQTVSRVLNDLPNVKASTKARVEVAIRQLNYSPSLAARALVTRRSHTIGVINTGATDFGPASIANGFNAAAGAADYAVSIASALDATVGSIRSALDLLLRQNVEAIVMIAASTGALEAIAGVELTVPLITVDSVGRPGFHSISLNQYRGARNAVAHLASLGHREILHLGGPADSLDAMERVRGWRDELGSLGLPAREPLVGDWTPRSGFEAGRSLASHSSEFGAIFVANDQMALGVMHAFAEAGVRVPDDVSLVGFDDIPEAEHFAPPLTTMRQDFDTLGRQLLDDLVSILAGSGSLERLSTVPELVVRSSTAAAVRE